ncbi:MAG: hypothetical protein H0T42_15205 [Deltaproteobacteria bacterium]|nr:hypothetical protein [Deltaproteobacteria bacterium]
MRFLILLGLCPPVSACKQAEPPPPGSEILAKTRSLSAAMCACKDQACGQPLRLQWDALTKEISGVTFSAEQVEGLATEDQRFMRCMAALAPAN